MTLDDAKLISTHPNARYMTQLAHHQYCRNGDTIEGPNALAYV